MRDNDYVDPAPDRKIGRVRCALMKLYRRHLDSGMLPTSNRFLFYELIGLKVIAKGGDQRPDLVVHRALTDLREQGLIPWEPANLPRYCRSHESKRKCRQRGTEGDTMRKAISALGCIGTIVFGTLVPAKAQYYYPAPGYPPPPDYDAPPPNYGYGYGYRTWNGCPPGYTVQGGNCAPYQGPVGGGWRTWNGCPPGYTVQGGNCAPYKGPVYGPGYGYYR
jgi:hypothetical protein